MMHYKYFCHCVTCRIFCQYTIGSNAVCILLDY
uniref:Uncharacterized protein n=1 Tax=Rhizophora mucronata TaxID=61149 RepID=A0A2P2QAM6_RHIMU